MDAVADDPVYCADPVLWAELIREAPLAARGRCAAAFDDARWNDARSALVVEPLRWAFALDALLEAVALEQVAPVLPLWEAYAECLRRRGYDVWTGVLNAADYGVPQTRKRAILMASRRHRMIPPTPSHWEHGGLFGPAWVSMADALRDAGHPLPFDAAELHTHRDQREDGTRQVVATEAPSPTFTGKSGSQWKLHTRGDRDYSDPRTGLCEFDPNDVAPTVVETTRSWRLRAQAEPARTLCGSRNPRWAYDRPATTIVGSFRPDIVAAPGFRRAGDGPRQAAEGSVPITVAQALILQSFPPDYPVAGSNTARFHQIGNAVPPLLAAHVLAAVLGVPAPRNRFGLTCETLSIVAAVPEARKRIVRSAAQRARKKIKAAA